ncbi:N-acetylmannosamine-6-phosphate 2-epimerase [Picosynechococcus sp. PCC 11901]|uniref:N-acetylmannosamine-6-phosphate 2-epimerase n=1 Tax=Picosynechococcus sp. PCC 11901 TaxID=2579791 RepID=UPI0010FBD246|nr:N-acetylmannosamine-6-phosphate 2-epimerase [Picosynechococcus sp. PCC 11901]QCS48670.1 N-acetylmannosamine-6-phosphate 2-epimerase [Picosynechococcus sp. PCC 11901]
MSDLIAQFKNRLIISCQAPADSPLHDPEMIAAIAQVCVNQGAVGVRIDSPEHIRAVRAKLPQIPIIGLWKRTFPESDVYITPRLEDALAVVEAGADIVAVDATARPRPNGETLADLIAGIHQQTGKLVMADLDTYENAQWAAQAGADILGTTLYGYTGVTKDLTPPGFGLLEKLAQDFDQPIICEGGIHTPEMLQKAFQLGADSVVVGTAITGVDLLAQKFCQAIAPGHP